MANYKINRNKPEITEEQIDKHKDFQKLINKHQEIIQYKKATKPLYKNPGFMSFMVVLGIVLLTIFITENDSNSTKKSKGSNTTITNDSTNEEKTIEPKESISYPKDSIHSKVKPVPTEINHLSATKPDYKQMINSIEGGVAYFGSTRILIPPYAFKDERGNLVKENVEIRFNEYRDPVSIAFASIPMHYDSAQKNMQLVSAGMFDVRGFVNNKSVQLSKPIQVELTTSQHTNYNLYYLNQANNEWKYVSKENKSYRFMVTGNELKYPELLPFKDIEWEFKPSNTSQLADFNLLFSKEWAEFIVEEELKPDLSTNVKFKRLASVYSLKVSPVKLTADAELNKQLLQAKYNLYKEGLKKKQRNEQLYNEAMLKQKAWLESFEGKKYLEWINTPEGQQQRLAMKVVSVFTINQFGIWNCDTPTNLPMEAKVNATFKDQNGQTLNLAEVRLVDYSKNTVYTYYKGVPIQFNPKAENVLWSALPGGKLAVFTKENFKTIPNSGNIVLVMNVIDIKGKTEEEIKNILAMKSHSTNKELEKEKNKIANYERTIVLKAINNSKSEFYSNDSVAINSNGIQRPAIPNARKKLPKW